MLGCACVRPQRLPSNGAYRIFYAPNTSAPAVQVAEMAAKELLCRGSPSVMRTVALGSSFYVDASGIAASGMLATCVDNPMACASYLHRRPGGLPASAALVSGNLAQLCAPACLASRACFGAVLAEFLTGFPSEADAVAAAAQVAAPDASHGGGVAALVVLPANLSASDDVTYTLRTNASDVPGARELGARWVREAFDPWVVAPSESYKLYWFAANVQRALDAAIISLKTRAASPRDAALLRLGGVADVTLATSVKQFPFLAYRTNLGASFAALFFGLVFVFAFLTTVVTTLKALVMEKELRIREGMLMMGLRGRTYWLSWFCTHYSTLAVIATLMALVGTYPFRNSNGFIMWIFYMVWFCSLLAFCYALSTLFSTSKIAAVAGSLLYILTWAPAVAATSGNGAHGGIMWTLVCVFPASSIYMFGLAVALLENAEEGFTWRSLFRNLTDSADSAFSAGGVLLMTLLGACGFAFWAWYLDKAAPREYGTRLPWWFPLSRSYWRNGHCGADAGAASHCASSTIAAAEHAADEASPASACSPDSTRSDAHEGEEETEEEAAALIAGAVERLPRGVGSACVVLRRLCKWFASASETSGRVTAVDNLSLSFYKGEITTLLGYVPRLQLVPERHITA